MIQPLRSVHRRAFLLLAFVLPLVLLAGLEARRPGRPSSVPVGQLPSSVHLVRRSDTLWQKHAIKTEFYNDPNHPGDIEVALYPVQELNEPDLLLYWSLDQPTAESLPAGAQLLGSFVAGKVFTLPTNVDRAGYLALFSLPHQTVYDSARVEKLP